jgi:hypothetical protein
MGVFFNGGWTEAWGTCLGGISHSLMMNEQDDNKRQCETKQRETKQLVNKLLQSEMRLRQRESSMQCATVGSSFCETDHTSLPFHLMFRLSNLDLQWSVSTSL